MRAASASLAQVMARMVDPRLGIVRRIAPVPLQPGEPPLHICVANCVRPKYFLRNRPFHTPEGDYEVPANGVGLVREQALWRALGEAAERYAGGLYAEERFVIASRERLGDTALPTERLIGFSPRQYAHPGFPFVPFDSGAPVRWAQGHNLTLERPSLVPATLVYLGYEAIGPQERFWPATSSGMAAGRCLEQALLNGLCELVERDGFMCAWLLRHVPRVLPLETFAAGLPAAERTLLIHPDLRLTVAEVTTDIGLPAVVAVLRPRDRGFAVIGAAAATSLRDALVRATIEAFHTLNWSIHLGRIPRHPSREQVRDLEDHVRYHLDPAHQADIAWLAEAEPPAGDAVDTDACVHPPGAPLRARLDAAVARLAQAGFEVHYVETTTADLRELGFRTVRVLVPGLQPLNVGWDRVHEDERRLARVAAVWGLSMPRPLNPAPHPFP